MKGRHMRDADSAANYQEQCGGCQGYAVCDAMPPAALPYKMRPGVFFACAGLRLTEEERAFFADADPLGFILFSNSSGR